MNPKKYQRKVRIEALQVTKSNIDEVAVWCRGVVVRDYLSCPYGMASAIEVKSVGGKLFARNGDYVVKGAVCEFRVRSESEFEGEWEEVKG